ncbi:MAG: hypothetical protein L0Z53_27715 [Acidobacteriales bacterium]|nr:hypothetical protein [Terriglobales bacterium]
MYRKPILIGVLIAALLMPVQVQAQWTVFDPANYGLQLKKQLEEPEPLDCDDQPVHADLRKCRRAVDQPEGHPAHRR